LFKALGGQITQTFEIVIIVFQNSSANLTLTNTISFVNMWNFIKGVKNPNLKWDRPEEKRQRDSLYDQEKRIRTFLESWKAMAAILDRIRSIAESCKTMTCNYCITFSKVKGSSSATNSFIAGCDNFRIEAYQISLFSYLKGKKNILKTVFLGKTFSLQKTLRLQDFASRFSKFSRPL
jgi:hypothetical protein